MAAPFTEQLSQGLSVIGVIPSTQINNGTADSTAVDMSKVRRLMAVVNVTAVAGGGSVTFRFRSSATAGGTYADIAGTTTTAVTAANKVLTLEIRADQMPSGQGFLELRATESGSQNVTVDAVLLGGCSEYSPANQYDLSTASVPQRLVA